MRENMSYSELVRKLSLEGKIIGATRVHVAATDWITIAGWWMNVR